MGRDKALLPVAGTAMARRVADALTAAGAVDVVAAGGDAEGLAAAGLRARPDSEPGAGPLAAVLDVLGAATHEVVLVVGCDLLAPDPGAMRAVVDGLAERPEAQVAVPVVDGVRQWHHAAWHRSALPALQAARSAGIGSLRRAVAALAVAEVGGVPSAAVADADRPEDLPGRGDRGSGTSG
jgi:molybdopterin-guanine dinucleotide biosynthesis protein A